MPGGRSGPEAWRVSEDSSDLAKRVLVRRVYLEALVVMADLIHCGFPAYLVLLGLIGLQARASATGLLALPFTLPFQMFIILKIVEFLMREEGLMLAVLTGQIIYRV